MKTRNSILVEYEVLMQTFIALYCGVILRVISLASCIVAHKNTGTY